MSLFAYETVIVNFFYTNVILIRIVSHYPVYLNTLAIFEQIL